MILDLENFLEEKLSNKPTILKRLYFVFESCLHLELNFINHIS
jgi:hypothetical protein